MSKIDEAILIDSFIFLIIKRTQEVKKKMENQNWSIRPLIYLN